MVEFVRRMARMLVGALTRSRLGGRVVQALVRATMENRRVVAHRGTQLEFVVPNYVNSWRVDSFATKEPETLEWIEGFESGSILWDIGANVGLYSCYAAKNRGCRVVAFEPSIFNLELLARNVWSNNLAHLVTIMPLPLSDRLSNSTLAMTTTDWGGAMSTFGHGFTHDGTEIKKVFEFRTVGITMDEAISCLGLTQPSHLKMDVDGIEHLILQGGGSMLKHVESVLIEINDDFVEQAATATRLLQYAGLTLDAKRHADAYENTVFKNCYNQIWRRR